MGNNINNFGYSDKRDMQWGEQIKGENSSIAGGLNLSYNTEGSNRYFISYLGSSNKKELEENISTNNFLPEGSYYQQSRVEEEERDTPHKVNFGVRHKFSEQHNLIIDGDLRISSLDLNSRSLTNSGFEDSLINSLSNVTGSESGLIDFIASGSYVAKSKQGKTQLKLEADGY